MVTGWMGCPLCCLGSLLPFKQLVDLAGPDLAHPGGIAGTGVRSIRLQTAVEVFTHNRGMYAAHRL